MIPKTVELLLLLIFVACAQHTTYGQCEALKINSTNCTCDNEPNEIISTHPYIYHNGTILLNNSYVDATNTNITLECHTNLMTCCNGTDSCSCQADWYWYSDEKNKVSLSESNSIYQNKSCKQVDLHFNVDESFGLYCCSIRMENGGDAVCVELNNVPENISLNKIEVDVLRPDPVAPEYMLTCVSYGSVATFHEWIIDDNVSCETPELIGASDVVYSSSVILSDFVSIVECKAWNKKVSSEPEGLNLSAYNNETVQAPVNVSAQFNDVNHILVKWSEDETHTDYLVFYNGSDGSEGMKKVDPQENGNGSATERIRGLSKCNNYTVGLQALSLSNISETIYFTVNASTFCPDSQHKNKKCSKSRQSQYPFISYNDIILPNNSYVNVNDGAQIMCHTDLSTCCNWKAGNSRGDWYLPDERRVQFKGQNDQFRGKIYQKRHGDQRVELNYNIMSTCYEEETFGVYCCKIETNEVNGCDRETVCVGLYKEKKEDLLKAEIDVEVLSEYGAEDPVYKLNCLFSGEVATDVSWMIDCTSECEDEKPVLNSNGLLNSSYSSSLVVYGDVGLVTCIISNNKPFTIIAEVDFRTYIDVGIPNPYSVKGSFMDKDLEIKWKSPHSYNNYSKIIGYTVLYKGDDGSEGRVKTKRDETSITLKGMSKCVNYEIQVRSDSIYNHSSYGNDTIRACQGTFNESTTSFKFTFECVRFFFNEYWTNDDAAEIEESIHSEIRKYLWPEDVTFCCGGFSYNQTNEKCAVTYSSSTDKLSKVMEWKNHAKTIQLGMFVVPIL